MVFFFFLAVYPPSSPPQNHLYNEPNPHSSMYVGGREEEEGGRRAFPPLTKVHQNGWFGHEKQCQETGLNFICTTHRKRKIEKKGVGLENEATLQVKVRGFFVLVRLSHACWPPRILLYNGLSTFVFYYNIIYLNVLLTKQNPSTTDQRCNRRSALCVFIGIA